MGIDPVTAFIGATVINTGVSLITGHKQKKAMEKQTNLEREEKEKVLAKGREIAGRRMVYLPQGERRPYTVAPGTGSTPTLPTYNKQT